MKTATKPAKVFLGTHLDEPDNRSLAIRAAELGVSKSALLKKLTLDFIAKSKPKPAA